MESLIFLAIVMIIAIPVLSFIILSKITSLSNKLDTANNYINILASNLNKLLQTTATKNDIEELKSLIQTNRETNATDYRDQIERDAPVIEPKEKESDESLLTQKPASDNVSIQNILSAIEDSHNQEVDSNIVDEENKTSYATIENHELSEDKATTEESISEKEKEEQTEKKSTPQFQATDNNRTPSHTYINNTRINNRVVKEKSAFTKLVTENILTKIGIITLVLGIAFFVKYAIDQNWITEVGRVGIGILTGALLIGIAFKLRKGYHTFSSILVGGGIATFYFTITLAFREYNIFTQPVAFAILIAITILSVIFAIVYDSRELAIFSILGGFASPLMISTGEGNYVILFSFILILNTGMLILSVYKNWKIIGTISYVLTLAFYMTWLIGSFDDEIVGALLFAILFYIQFYILTLIDHFKSNRKLLKYHAILLLSNNLFILISCLTILNDVTPDMRGVAVISIAIFNAIVLITLYKIKKVDNTLIYLLIAVVLSFVTLAVPIQLHGNAITMFWAAESVILLWLWRRSQIKTFSYGFVGISVLVVVSYWMDLSSSYNYWSYKDAIEFTYPTLFFNRIFITGFIIVLSYIANIWLTRDKDENTQFLVTPITVRTLNQIFKVLLVISAYVVIYFELNMQLSLHINSYLNVSLKPFALLSFTGVYVALLTFVTPQKVRQTKFVFYLLFTFIIGYTIAFLQISKYLISDLFVTENVDIYRNYSLFIHIIPLLALAIIIRAAAKQSKKQTPIVFNIFSWVASILSVVVLSIESKNITLFMFSQNDDYYYIHDILQEVYSLVFPILWGIIAMILMVWGLKSREVVLRKISLAFFAIIIIKFYAYDVWNMSQAGRIISFVILGVILLVVSFLQQKIKTLVKDNKKLDTETEDNKNDTNQPI